MRLLCVAGLKRTVNVVLSPLATLAAGPLITVNSFIGFLGDRHVHLADHVTILLPFLALALVGIVVGARLSKRISGEQLRPAFGWFILAMGVYILLRELYTLNG